jgi:hypothetical protein
MQMVDDDEVENVGIMSGFMDDIEELMEEIAQQEMAGEGDDADMARILGRSPDSPEVLMNNLRGDYRSIDARREELADRVGYNAAQQTPDEVLAMLQPVFAQQGVAALPMGAADMGPLPMDALTGMPPPGGMPPAAMPMDPAMMGAPPAGMPPMDPAMMAQMPPEGIASLPMDQGAMPPMQMARGGIVQHFERGGAAASATESISPIDEYLAQRPQAAIDPMVRTRELTPEYQELLGISDRGATQAQMLFDIAQAALGYASNVGPDGQPLRGSGAARLAGATRALPGQIGARAAAMQDDQTRARLAALQQAQSEREATIASNTALSADQRAILLAKEKQAADMALEREKQKAPTEAYRTLEARSLMLPEAERAAFIARGGAQDASSNLQDFFGSVDGGPAELLLFSPDVNNPSVSRIVDGALIPVTGQVTRADAPSSVNLQRVNASVSGGPTEMLFVDPSNGKFFRNVGGEKVEVTEPVTPAIEFMRDPVTGATFKLDTVTGLAEPVTQRTPDEPNTTAVFEFMQNDLNFNPGAGTGAGAAFINAWNNTLGQIPIMPVGETTSAAAQTLRNLERKAVDALKLSNRPPIFEQEKIGELLPNPVSIFQNPELATNRIVDFVNMMADQYVNDMRYATNINNRDDEARTTSLSRARAFKSIINDIITPEASAKFFETLDVFEGGPAGILDMSDQEFNNLQRNGFSGLTPQQLDAAEARIRNQ